MRGFEQSIANQPISISTFEARTFSSPRPLQRAALVVALATALCALLCGCGTAKVAQRHEFSPAPAARPAVVYVADFDIDAANIKSENGILPAPPKPPGPLGDSLPGLPGAPKDPQVLARELVDTLSNALVKDLTKAGYTARRLAPHEPIPTSGWLVRGVFTEVNQGNQLCRSVIGFGLGKTDLQVVVDVNDLAQGAPKKFYELNTTANSGKAPGAGPMIVFGPAGVAARFVIAGGDLKRNTKQTAAQIATEVAAQTAEKA